MRFASLGTAVATVLVLAGAPARVLAGIEVFSASHIPLSNVPGEATVVELDALAGLDEILGQNLSARPGQAGAQVMRRLQSPQGRQVLARYEHAATAVARAWVLGIQKIPAVVVDEQYVVYGQPDVAEAMALISRATP